MGVESVEEPFDMADLRVSCVKMADEVGECTGYFEQALRDMVGEARFKKAQQIIDNFKEGDVFYEKYELKLLQ